MNDSVAALQRLVDEAELRDLIHTYALAIDRRDWELWQSIFTDDVLIDLTDYEPEPAPRRVPTSTLVPYLRRLFTGLDASQHFIGTNRVAIDGERATVTAHMRAEHWLSNNEGGDRYTMYGTYTDECVRTPGGWRITAVKLALLREEGNRHLMRLAARRGKQRTEGNPE